MILDDPEPAFAELRRVVRADLFTFLQRLPETAPKYSYPMEWDNLAALPITSLNIGGTNDWFQGPEQGSKRKKGA